MADVDRPAALDGRRVAALVAAALAEDVGWGDVTTLACVPADASAQGRCLAKAPGVIAGLVLARESFLQLDPAAEFTPLVADGDPVITGGAVFTVRGNARALLTGERVALNFLQRLSGIATLTARCATLIAGTGARLVDTRKTTPGLRLLEKYAVRAGGGANHRFGLSDGVLIKENHIAAAGGIAIAVARARAAAHHLLRVEVEVRDLEELEQALAACADVVLLDNMDLATLREAVRRTAGRAMTEASGGVTEATIRAVAETGVALISLGALTHSAPALDLSLLLT